LLRYSVCILMFACGNASRGQAAPHSDGGLMLNLPDATPSCAGASAQDAGEPATSTCVPQRHRDFVTDVQPLFASCSGEVCHDFTASGLRASIGVASLECCTETPLIAPGFPERSYLLDKVRGAPLCSGLRMPIDKPPLGDDEIQAISDRICEGAPTE
jgi:hypothetical protein